MKKKVLIADDDKGITEVVEIILTDAGYTVIIERDGTQVLSTIQKQLPHLVLLDLSLSGENGAEIVKVIKKQKHTRHIPVLLVSGSDKIHEITNDTGADGYLTKPFDIDVLVELVKSKMQ